MNPSRRWYWGSCGPSSNLPGPDRFVSRCSRPTSPSIQTRPYMRFSNSVLVGGALVALSSVPVLAQTSQGDSTSDPVKELVGRLELEKYKSTIKGLTQFGDRRQGTERNRKAVDWIEAQLKSYGCANTARIVYTYDQAPRGGAGGAGRAGGGGGGADSTGRGRAGGRGGADSTAR